MSRHLPAWAHHQSKCWECSPASPWLQHSRYANVTVELELMHRISVNDRLGTVFHCCCVTTSAINNFRSCRRHLGVWWPWHICDCSFVSWKYSYSLTYFYITAGLLLLKIFVVVDRASNRWQNVWSPAVDKKHVNETRKMDFDLQNPIRSSLGLVNIHGGWTTRKHNAFTDSIGRRRHYKKGDYD